MILSHVLQKFAFTGAIVLFEGSPSIPAKLKAVVELKLKPAGIN